MSRKREFACWKCGARMRKKALACKRCRRAQPAAVKSQIAALGKAFGAPVRPVPVTVAKAARPRCPDPACRAKGGRKANCCARCGTPFTAARAGAAGKAARAAQAAVHGTPEYWQARAAAQYSPEEREACLAEASKALKAQGRETAELARLLVQSSGAASLREAYLKATDPRAQAILRGVLDDQERRTS